MMLIKRMEKKDIDSVYEIECACFSNPWSREDIAGQLELETSHFLVALVDNRVAGYMGLQIFSGEGYVTNVAVLPEYRRQGIAEALIKNQLENEMEFISLEVRQSNAPAISLYEKCGFENVGIRPNFYTNPNENAIIMTKQKDNL